MALDLVDYEHQAREAVKAFWGNREAARENQIKSGRADQGERAGVTAGTSPRGAASTGEFSEMSAMTGLKTFVTTLAGHVAAAAARLG